MKAVILAAGLCTRIRQSTKGLPKCLLKFGDSAILDYQIDSLFEAGITSLAIVVGYGKEHIIEHVAKRHAGKSRLISFVENPQFAFTNNIYSLWLANEWIGENDFICLNSDVLYHPRIILPAVSTRADISVIIDQEWRDETMKVIIRDGTVRAMSKAIPREEFSGTYANITTFSRRIRGQFFGAMEELIAAGHVNVFFNAAVERLIGRGVPVSYTPTGGLPWAEVDDASDLWYAQTQVYPRLIPHSAGMKGSREGGTELRSRNG